MEDVLTENDTTAAVMMTKCLGKWGLVNTADNTPPLRCGLTISSQPILIRQPSTSTQSPTGIEAFLLKTFQLNDIFEDEEHCCVHVWNTYGVSTRSQPTYKRFVLPRTRLVSIDVQTYCKRSSSRGKTETRSIWTRLLS